MTDFTTYHHGVRIVEVPGSTRPARTIATAIIGLIATAADATAGVFPLNQPAIVTDIDAAIAAAGVAGTLSRSLKIIRKHGAPVIVVVRVAPGADDAATADAVLDGLEILRTSPSAVGVQPRIIGAPGLDHLAPTLPAAIADVAAELEGFAYAACQGDDTAERLAFRDTLSDRELMVIHGDFRDATGVDYAVAHALGLRARVDNDRGFHHSISNIAVEGVTGITAPVTETEAQLLNEAGITVLRNRAGAFHFWGVRTCSDDANFVFESATRIAQVLKASVRDIVLSFNDRPLHPSLARDIIESINGKGQELVRLGVLLGFNAWLASAAPDDLQQGKLRIDYDYTDVPPLEDLGLRQKKTDRYFADFAARASGLV